MIRTPEQKTIVEILYNIIQPIWISTFVLYHKLNLSTSVYTLSMIACFSYLIMHFYLRKRYESIEYSKSVALQLTEKVTTKIGIGINIIVLILIIFLRGK